MSTANACHNNAPASCKFNLDGIKFGTKFMSEIMDASTAGQEWATKILEADRQSITHARLLTPNNGRNNLYGAIRFGIQPNIGFTSKEPEVKAKLGEWVQSIRELFPATATYTPEQLAQRVSDASAAAKCIKKNTETLAGCAELSAQDANQLGNLVAGLESFAEAGKVLLAALDGAKCDIDLVNLDIVPNQH